MIAIGNEPEFLSIFFAVVTLGWIAIPFDPKWSDDDKKYVLKVTKPDLFVGEKQKQHEKVTPLRSLLVSREQKTPVYWHHHREEIFYIGFTSDSTGTPKGFMRSHHSWLKSFEVAEEAFQYGKGDIITAPGPLCHSLSLFAAVHALHVGAIFYIFPKFEVSDVLQMMEQKKANVYYVVPTMLQAIVMKAENLIQSRLKILTSGAKLTKSLLEKIEAQFPNSELFEYYGASELSFVSYSNKEMREKKRNSVGKLFPNVTVKIMDENGKVLPVGEIGEVCVQSELLFSGYVQKRSRNRSCFNG